MPASLEVPEESLIEAMQRIYSAQDEDYTELTILGSDINQIRHMFYYLLSEEVPVQVYYQTETYKGRITEAEGSIASLYVPRFDAGSARRCRIKFEHLSQMYQFEVPILELQGETLRIRIPSFLQAAQKRKHRRIFVDDLFLRFNVLYSPLFGRRGDGQMIESRYPAMVTELRRDFPDLYLLTRILTEEILKVSPDFEFRFYKKGDKLSLRESTLVEEQKTIYIQDALKLESYFERQTLLGLINYNKEYTRMLKYNSEEEVRAFFEKVRQADTQNFVRNYVCLPLIVFDSVIGHILVYSSVLDKGVVSADQAYLLDLLVKMLNYALSKTAIARTYYTHTLTRIVNISMSGLLFEVQNKVLFDFLTNNDLLKMLIQIRYHMLELKGEIMRFFPTRNGFNIGVNFFDSSPDDFKVLENYIFATGRMAVR